MKNQVKQKSYTSIHMSMHACKHVCLSIYLFYKREHLSNNDNNFEIEGGG